MKTTSEMDRTANDAEKEGVFTGAYAINPMNGEKIPIWIANYVLDGIWHRCHYGSSGP